MLAFNGLLLYSYSSYITPDDAGVDASNSMKLEPYPIYEEACSLKNKYTLVKYLFVPWLHIAIS